MRDRCFFVDVDGVHVRVHGDASKRSPEMDEALADLISAAQRRLIREQTDPTTVPHPTSGGTP